MSLPDLPSPRLAIRRGAVAESGAYFSLAGSSTYHDPAAVASGEAVLFDLSAARLADSFGPEGVSVLEAALALLGNTVEDEGRIRAAMPLDSNDKPVIDYGLADGVPSVVAAAKSLGFDGLIVWENDDWTQPSSVFIWNVEKTVPASPQTLAAWQAQADVQDYLPPDQPSDHLEPLSL